MRVVISKRAQAQLDRIDAWWYGHRDKAPERFEDELEEAKKFLEKTPALASVFVVRGRRTIRWVLLPKTKVKLYFWVLRVSNGLRLRQLVLSLPLEQRPQVGLHLSLAPPELLPEAPSR